MKVFVLVLAALFGLNACLVGAFVGKATLSGIADRRRRRKIIRYLERLWREESASASARSVHRPGHSARRSRSVPTLARPALDVASAATSPRPVDPGRTFRAVPGLT